MRRGHPALGGFAGFLFGLSLDVTLLVFGVLRLDSILLVILPVALLLLGVLWGVWAPFGARRDAVPAQTQPPAPPAAQAK